MRLAYTGASRPSSLEWGGSAAAQDRSKNAAHFRGPRPASAGLDNGSGSLDYQSRFKARLRSATLSKNTAHQAAGAH